MTRTCIIDQGTGTVVNVVEMGRQSPLPTIVEYSDPPPGTLFVASDTAQIGWTLVGGVLTAPVATPPSATPVA